MMAVEVCSLEMLMQVVAAHLSCAQVHEASLRTCSRVS